MNRRISKYQTRNKLRILLCVKLVITFILFFGLPAEGQVSVYHPFPDTNAIWRVNYYNTAICASQGVYYYEENQYTLSGDTFIAPYTYKKVYISGYSVNTFISPCNWAPTYFYNYAGCLRQDSANKKVFSVNTSNADTLLYDFNKNVGDTLHLWAGHSYTCTIQSIDSVLIGNNYHKRFNIFMASTSYSGISMIEGIGSTAGIFGGITRLSYFSNGSPNQGPKLVCFSHKTDVYPSDSSSCTLLSPTTGIVKQVNSDANQIIIYPNPSNSIVGVTLLGNNKVEEISLVDVLGKEVLTTKETIIDVSSLQEGIYFVQVKTADGVATKKIIIQR